MNKSAVILSGPAALLLLAFLIAKLSSSNLKALVLKSRVFFKIFPLFFSGGNISAFHYIVCSAIVPISLFGPTRRPSLFF